MRARWLTRFPAQPKLQLLGVGIGAAASPFYPRHAELTAHLFERMGWEPGEMVGFRLYRIRRGSLGRQVGLRSGDIVTAVNQNLLVSAECPNGGPTCAGLPVQVQGNELPNAPDMVRDALGALRVDLSPSDVEGLASTAARCPQAQVNAFQTK